MRRACLLAPLILLLCGCGPDTHDASSTPARSPNTDTNPIAEWAASPSAVPPFEAFDVAEVMPALEHAIAHAQAEYRRIVGQPARPTIDNTLLPFEAADDRLARIARLVYGLEAVTDDPSLARTADRVSERLDRFSRSLLADRTLVGRLQAMARDATRAATDPAATRLLERTRQRLARAGALLEDPDRQRLTVLDTRLDALERKLRDALRRGSQRPEILIDTRGRLEAMPPHLVDAAARRASDRGHDGGWAFTLHTHSFQAMMRHHGDRADRERLYRLWQRRDRGTGLAHASPDGIIERLAALRAQRAALLGRGSHFEQSLAASAMLDAGRLETVLRSLVPVARQRARDELRRMRELARDDGVSGPLRPWDVWYYRQRLLEACPGEPLDPNLDAGTVRAALFATVAALWDLRLRPAPELATWHPDASAWRVADAEGRSLGLLYLDLFYRPGKAGGAWTSVYATPGETDEPIVAVVTNFDRAGAGGLDLEDVRALFHEFGHALHSLLSAAAYPALAPSNLPPDFGEFPAILLERLATHPEVFRRYGNGAADVRGGIEARLRRARCRERAVAGLDAMQLIAAIELERLLHGATDRQAIDLRSAERRVRERLELPPPLSPRHHGSGLAGLFAAPRHGGDFATLWAEILASDAFSSLDAGDSIDRDRAEVFREEILSGSGSRPVDDAWIAFMGRAPLPYAWIDARAPAAESSYESKIPSGE